MTGAELERLTPREIHDLQEAWKAREKRADFRAGQIAAVIANCNRDPREAPSPFEPADFFPMLDRDRPEVTEEQLLGKAMEAFGLRG